MQTQTKETETTSFMARFALLMLKAKEGDVESLDVLNEAQQQIKELKKGLKQAQKPQAMTFDEFMSLHEGYSNIIKFTRPHNHERGKRPSIAVIETAFVDEGMVELEGYRLLAGGSTKKRKDDNFFDTYYGATAGMPVTLKINGTRLVIVGFKDGVFLTRMEG